MMPLTNRFAIFPRLWSAPRVALPASRLPAEARRPAWTIRPWLAQRFEGWWPWVLVVISGLLHGINMFNYPYYENDEGTYVSQAWAVLERGMLAQYTYWYDHAPAGWIQIAAWAALTNGFYTFGTSVDSGRVLMLVFQCASTYLLYRLAHAVSGSVLTSTLVTLMFALSAYGIYFHRRVLLDNITTPWMLLSILLIVRQPMALTRVWGSAIALGISILSKELTVFLIPVLTVTIFVRADRSQRWFATIGWLIVVVAIFSSYPLMALLKNELFPSGTFLGGTAPHVSLIESLQYQMARGRDGGLFSFESAFWQEMRTWSEEEPVLLIGGTGAAILSALSIRWRPLPGLGLLTLSLYAFLGRGGAIIAFYLVPLLPLLALNLGLLLGPAIERLQTALERGGPRALLLRKAVPAIACGLCLTVLSQSYYSQNLGFAATPSTLWTNTQVVAQKDAVGWLRRNVRSDAAMIMDCYPWLDLQAPPSGLQAFPKAHWYWKLDADPEVGIDVFRDDPRTTDYLLVTAQMVEESRRIPSLRLVREAIQGSTTIARFDTGGYPMEIRRVAKLQQWPATTDPMLVRTWADYKSRFINGGRVMNLDANRETTSEGQAYALLRAVYLDDRATFDDVWSWTRSQLQVRGDGLLAWRFGAAPDGTERVLDLGAVADADQDAALALLFAARRWHSTEYHRQAITILEGIWEHETAVVAGRRIVVAGGPARGETGDAVVNPSYLGPYAYRIFAEADQARNWRELVDSSYELIAAIQSAPDLGGPSGLVPNWVALDRTTGQPRLTSEPGAYGSEFSYDASRLPWRLALDLVWFQDPRAKQALLQISLPARELARTGRLAAAYDLDGRPAVENESLSMYTGVIPSLLFRGDDDLAHRTFADHVLRRFNESQAGASWGDRDSSSDQHWAWFASAFMDGAMSNLWAEQTVVEWEPVLARIARMPVADVSATDPAGLARAR